MHGVVASFCVAAAAPGAEPFRLTEWPAGAPNPAFHLIDWNHERRSLEDYRGRVAVVLFGFTHCPDVCPGELLKLAQAVKRLGPLAAQVQVLFVTLDPERDSPELLKSYVAWFDPRFVALTGSTAAINAAADSFSVQFAKVPEGKDYAIDHSTGIYAFDKKGRLRLVGSMATSADDWVHDLAILAGG
jgi:protein SCO1/2